MSERGEAYLMQRLSGSMSDMATSSTGIDNAAPIQNRRVMSSSSGFFSSVNATVRASSAMPHFGQEPGASRTIFGMHRAGIFSLGQRRADVERLQRHAALRTSARALLAHLGVHRTSVDCASRFRFRWRVLM